MRTVSNNLHKLLLSFAALLALSFSAGAQFTDCSSGLLQMPSADMQEECTLMVTTNFLNKHMLPTDGWNYNTIGYGFDITFWSRLEITYSMTVFNGRWRPEDPSTLTERERIILNQDRHFNVKVQILKEGDFASWVPSLAVGIIDPPMGGKTKWLVISHENGNDYFNRLYVAASKHFQTHIGDIGAHVAYLYNERKGYPLNGPAVGVTWNPKWLNGTNDYLSSFRVIAEYDARTFNMGVVASIWKDYFDVMLDLQNFRWFSGGVRFKLVLK